MSRPERTPPRTRSTSTFSHTYNKTSTSNNKTSTSNNQTNNNNKTSNNKTNKPTQPNQPQQSVPLTPTNQIRISEPNSASSSTSSASTNDSPFYKYTIKNLPQTASQKSLYGLLVQLGVPICTLKVNWNCTALLICPSAITTTHIKHIQESLNSPTLTITPIGPRQKPQPTVRPPTYSCVLRDVDKEITPEDVADALSHLQLPILKAVRIISRATNNNKNNKKYRQSIHIPTFITYEKLPAPPPAVAARGVALLFKTNLTSTLHPLPNHLNHLECIAADLQINNLTILIISYYNPPNEPLSLPLFDYASQHQNCIILGDFNARHVDFGDHYSNRNGGTLISALDRHPLTRLLNRMPTCITHHGSSINDHIIISDSLINFFSGECTIGTTITSDHLPLVTTLLLDVHVTHDPQITTYDYKRADWDKYKLHFLTLPLATETTDKDTIDIQIDTLTETIIQARSLAIPTKSFIPSRSPLPPRILNLIKEKRKLYRQYTRTHDPDIKTSWNRLNATIRLQINAFREHSWTETCSRLDYRDGREFWSEFKKLTGQKTSTSHTHLYHNNTYYSTDIDKSNLFASFLSEIHQIPQDPLFQDNFLNSVANKVHRFRTDPNLPQPHHNPLPNSDTLTEHVHPDDVANYIYLLNNRKSPGPDSIQPLLLKNLPETAITYLTSIFNNCLSACYFPNAWKLSHTIMIPKPNKSPENPSSYRPIALLNTLGKLLEKILAHRLSSLCESNNILPATQFGFRAKHSTIDPLLKLHTDTTKSANLGMCTLGVFLDIERAFDTVWHDGLILKLTHLRFPHEFTKLISSFLANRLFRIKVLETLSNPTTISAGVPQGSPLSPILYSIYCSDIPLSDSPRTSTVLFADDTACWSSQPNVEKAHEYVQKSLKDIEAWARRWRIKPNPSKTQAILFTNANLTRSKRFINPPTLFLWNQPLKLSNTITYLGITFSHTCSFTLDLRMTLTKARKRANLLGRLRGKFGRGCNPETLNHTYKTFIRPIFEYRSVLYATLKTSLLNTISSFERRLTRKNFRLHFRHPSITLYPATNNTPIQERFLRLQQRYVRRTVGNDTVALETLRTPWFYRRQRLTKRPRKRSLHPPTALLSTLYPDLPEELNEVVENTPYILR